MIKCGEGGARLLNSLFINGAGAFGIKREKGATIFSIPFSKLGLLEDAAKHFGISAEVERIGGLVSILPFFAKRTGITAGLAVSLALLFASPRFVWDIRFEEGMDRPVPEILEALRDAGIEEGSFIPALNLNVIEDRFLIGYGGASHISINVEGSVANIILRFREEPPPGAIPSGVSNIVAEHDGQIVRLAVSSGQVMVRAGDTVKRGDLLVSGIVDSRIHGAVTARSAGVILASTVRSVEVFQPYAEDVEELSGGSVSDREVKIFKSRLPLFRKEPEYKRYATEDSVSKYLLFGFIRLPVYVIEHTYSEIVTVSKEYGEEEALALAYARLEELIAQETSGAESAVYQIFEEFTEEGVLLICELSLIEDIGREVAIDLPIGGQGAWVRG